MWWMIANAVAAAALQASAGKPGQFLSCDGANPKWVTPKAADDWRDMERERMAELRRETAATQRSAILGAFLFVALAAAIAYAVYQTIWGAA